MIAALFTGVDKVSAATAENRPVVEAPGASKIRLAVIGDSDSQGFQDLAEFHAAATPRGGAYHASTFQWTEALSRLRGDQLDLGAWGVHGMRGRVAIALEWLGLADMAESRGWEVRAPIKQDHRYNFAYSGDGCADLFGGWSRQVPRLVRTMDAEPDKWRTGVVVFRIGGNNFANDPTNLGLLAEDRNSAGVRGRMDYCLGEVRKSVAAIHARHQQVRVVLVGVFDNSNWEKYFDRWESPRSLANISAGLDYYDDSLQRIAASDPRIAFFSDRKWFDSVWGARGVDGRPNNYRVFSLGPNVRVTNSGGDAPTNATLDDGHAGLVWNALWAQALVKLIDSRFGLNIVPISDEELLRFLIETGAFQHSNKTL